MHTRSRQTTHGSQRHPVVRGLLLVFLVPAISSLFAASPGRQGGKLSAPPTTPKRPVFDEYHGVRVEDNYRWLEDWSDPAVKQWSAAENQRTRAYLDQLPARAETRDELRDFYSGASVRYYQVEYRPGAIFALKMQPPKQQGMLVRLQSPDDLSTEKVVVDPNTMSSQGSIAIDFYAPSLDGKLVAVSLSKNGSEDGTGYVFDAQTGKELSDRVPRVNFATAGGSIAWNADASGFYYTRYPQGNERPKEDGNFYQQVYFHKLGTDSAQDSYVIGKEFPRIAEIQLRTDRAGKYLLVSVANGDGGQFAHWLKDPSGNWKQVTGFDDQIVSAKFGQDGYLYLLSRKDAPRGEVFRVSLANPELSRADTVVQQSSGDASKNEDANRSSIEAIFPAKSKLYVLDIAGGPSRLRVIDTAGSGASGTTEGSQQLAPTGAPYTAIREVVPLTGDTVLYYQSRYLEPPAWYEQNGDAPPNRTAMVSTSRVHFDDAEVLREFTTSKDGTKIPLNIIRRKGIKLDGGNPTLLEGYGGYGVSYSPGFIGPFGRIWLDSGGVLVIANLRGGGEYGEEWHAAGKLTKKQNVFDDFAACAQYLIDQKYTSPRHLAILGGSNGGLLMGAELTQHPDMFRAVISYVGIYDMLRVELDPNGTFNVTEFGTVKDARSFQALYAYSPYHHVTEGTKYPSILFLTGENDSRVNPMQSRKMVARLQAADPSGTILLRTSSSSGHGIGTSLDEQIQQDADVLSFLFAQLGMTFRPSRTM